MNSTATAGGTGVRLDRHDGGVVMLTVDHPPANSLTLRLREQIRATWRQCAEDDAVRAVVVTGAGDRFFSSGLDMVELDGWHRHGSADQRRRDIDQMVWDPLSAGLYKPVIAAVNGYCLAGGFFLALMCDVRIADERAEFGIPEVRWEHPAVFAWMLARQLHVNHVLELVLWAERRYSAQRMWELGFVNAVAPAGTAVETALDWAREVSRLSPAALEAHKRLVYASAVLNGAGQTQRRSERLTAALHDRPEAGAAVRRFLDRRRDLQGG